MLTLVVGDAASGKSAYAEGLLSRSDASRRIYLATMEPDGAEAAERIARHRAMRRDKGFETIECYVNLSRLQLPADSAVLMEDIGNLCANEMFSPQGSGDAAGAVLCGIAHIARQCRDLVIVSNEVFTGGAHEDDAVLQYLSVLSYVNRKLAAAADAVCEVSGGIPMYYKGEEA